MTRIPTSLYATRSAASAAASTTSTSNNIFTSRSTTLLLFLFFAHILTAAASQAPAPPLPLPTFHDVVAVAVAPGVAAAAVPEHDLIHHNNDNQQQHQHQQLLHRHDSRQGGAYTSLVTPAPSNQDKDNAQVLLDQGFRQETYYACVTPPGGGQEHCAWHVPVLKAQHGSAAAVPGRATDTGIVVAVVVGLAGVFAVGMM